MATAINSAPVAAERPTAGCSPPYAGMAIGEASRRTLRTGARWQLGADIGVRLEASRSESAEREDAEMQVRAAVRF